MEMNHNFVEVCAYFLKSISTSEDEINSVPDYSHVLSRVPRAVDIRKKKLFKGCPKESETVTKKW